MLGSDAAELAELAAEVGAIGKAQFSSDGFVGITLCNKLLCKTEAQVPGPLGRGFVEVGEEVAFKLAQGDGTQGSHGRGAELGVPRHPFPILNF